MKKLWFVPVVSMLAFAACSSESSNEPDFGGTGELQGFIPMSLNAYEMDNDMNVIKVFEPVCKEEKRELVWARTGADTIEYDYKYDSDKGLVYLGEGNDKIQFDYLGSSFPKGSWRMSSSGDEDGTFITEGMVFESDKVEMGIAYSGNCFLKDIYAGQMGGGVFDGDEEDEDSEDTDMSAFMKYVTIDCDKMTVGDSVVIKTGSWSRDGVETKYTYGTKSCSNKISYRFAYNEKDCKAAYDDFKENAKSGSVFDFEDYSTVNSNQECYEEAYTYMMTYLMQLVMEDAFGGLGDLLGGGAKASAAKLAKNIASLKVAK